MYFFYIAVKADPTQKGSEEAEAAAGLGPDLTASVETTYSEQSSSSAGSSSSSDQPIYFRYVGTKIIVMVKYLNSVEYRMWDHISDAVNI